ncbi:MAG: GPP34 family phosphoprotein [Acidimicrobiales bacterium]
MLLAEELALLAVDPAKGRPAIGAGQRLNACLAGLLVAELLLDGAAGPGDHDDRVVLTGSQPPPSTTLAAAAEVVGSAGPKIKAILSHMSRGLGQLLGTGTWDTAVAGLVDAGVLGPAAGGLRPRHDLVDPAVREAIVGRLQAAAAGDGPIESRTALVLSMTGPANLLEVVAPQRSSRRHAATRIDHALDGSDLEPVAKVVRRLIHEAAAAAATAAVIASGAAVTGG